MRMEGPNESEATGVNVCLFWNKKKIDLANSKGIFAIIRVGKISLLSRNDRRMGKAEPSFSAGCPQTIKFLPVTLLCSSHSPAIFRLAS